MSWAVSITNRRRRARGSTATTLSRSSGATSRCWHPGDDRSGFLIAARPARGIHNRAPHAGAVGQTGPHMVVGQHRGAVHEHRGQVGRQAAQQIGVPVPGRHEHVQAGGAQVSQTALDRCGDSGEHGPWPGGEYRHPQLLRPRQPAGFSDQDASADGPPPPPGHQVTHPGPAEVRHRLTGGDHAGLLEEQPLPCGCVLGRQGAMTGQHRASVEPFRSPGNSPGNALWIMRPARADREELRLL